VELGIFTRTFERPTLGGVLDAVVESGFPLVHFNFRSVGLPALPERLSSAQCAAVRREVEARGLRMAGVSATFNAIHPDYERRSRETEVAQQVILRAPDLGTRLVSLSTGTRDPDDMWRGSPANDEPSAWDDLRYTLARLLDAARRADVILGIEPEHNNVVSSARRARELLDEFHDEHLRIIFDAANLLTPETAGRQRPILAEAFDLLAPDSVVIHAKDLAAGGDVAAGRGLLDYVLYFELVAQHSLTAPVVIHEVAEDDVGRARDFVLARAAAAGLAPRPTP
jgi:sugar phosphate isomerase/epimerase